MLPVVVLPAARRDQLHQAEYYEAHGGEAIAERFLRQCEIAFERLARFPESGARVRYRNPKLAGCRFVLAPKFESILVFYRLGQGRVEIVRVLHGARDIEGVMETEPDPGLEP